MSLRLEAIIRQINDALSVVGCWIQLFCASSIFLLPKEEDLVEVELARSKNKRATKGGGK